jgi:hypothetical protein
MAEEKIEPREINFRQWLPWTQLFRGFWIALDPKKLLLAAAGIVVMAIGWWVLAWIFSQRAMPDWASGKYQAAEYDPDPQEGARLAWNAFKRDRNSWNLLHEAAGAEVPVVKTDAGDLADRSEEYEDITKQLLSNKTEFQIGGKKYQLVEGPAGRPATWHIYYPGGYAEVAEKVLPVDKPHGKLRTWPWYEDRGPNPFLLVSGKAGHPGAAGAARHVPWNRGEFLAWFVTDQVPFLVEPLVKFLRPVVYLLHPSARLVDQLYFLLVIIWTVATWALFGGAITRLAAVEIARNEKIGLGESIRFFRARWRSYLFASFAPLMFLAFLAILLMLFGAVNWIPLVGELWSGLLWFIPLAIGLAMAVLLVGMVGWPMIHATLSAEGSDSFDALSRSYSYVLQRPWSYIWYALVALAYGAVVVFFVGFMGSLMVYLGKWGVDSILIKGTSRDPSFMFLYAPTSFDWKELLLQDSPVLNDSRIVSGGAVETPLRLYNYPGPVLVGAWLYLFFLLVIGFGYSYFWSASTMIYFLMRRKVDDTEMDEVYLEEEDLEEPYSAPAPMTSAASPAGETTTPVQMVESPTLRQVAAPGPASQATTTAVETAAPKSGDGEAGGSGTSS